MKRTFITSRRDRPRRNDMKTLKFTMSSVSCIGPWEEVPEGREENDLFFWRIPTTGDANPGSLLLVYKLCGHSEKQYGSIDLNKVCVCPMPSWVHILENSLQPAGCCLWDVACSSVLQSRALEATSVSLRGGVNK